VTDALHYLLPVPENKSDFEERAKPAEIQDFSPVPLAQSGASERARQSASHARENFRRFDQELGEPLSIQQVAALLGCSAWTVRQRYLPQGLPHLRACRGGRITFFRDQVTQWILKRQQQKGGNRK